MAENLLRAILGITGLVLALLALNTAIGGAGTLGWQFPAVGFEAGEALNAARHDSNARFFAGVFCALSLIVAAGCFWLHALKPTIVAFLLAIAAGGLFRLAQAGYSPLTDTALLPSLLAEVIGAPLLAFWVVRQSQRH